MKLKSFVLEGNVLSAVLETRYFVSHVVLDKSRTPIKWIFGVKSLTDSYKNSVKNILRDVLETKKLPKRPLTVKPV